MSKLPQQKSEATILQEMVSLLHDANPNHGYQQMAVLREHCPPLPQPSPVQDALFHYSGYWAYLSGHYTEAIEWFNQAIKTPSSYYPESLYYLGLAYYQAGFNTEAIETFTQALNHVSNEKQANNDTFVGNINGMLGLVYNTCGSNDLAKQHLTLATQKCPNDPIFWRNLGAYYERMFEYKRAKGAFTQGLNLDKTQITLIESLARIEANLDNWNESQALYKQLLQQAPSLHTYLEAATQLPYIYQSSKHLHQHRSHYCSQLLDLLEQPIDIPVKQARMDLDQLYQSPIFALPYQGQDDRDIVQAMGQLLTKWMQIDVIPSPVVNSSSKALPRITEPIRLGFISRYLKPNYTVGKLYLNLIKNLPQHQFEIVLIHIETFFNPNEHQQWTKHENVTIGHVPSNQSDIAVDLIKQAKLDIAFYPDAITDAASYLIATHRLAPIQCTSWGHPLTSGLPNMDYYISSHLIEADNAQEHYTESLVLMDNLPVMYEPKELTKTPSNTYQSLRAVCKLPESSRVYYCPQSLFKLHPDFDEIVKTILTQDTQGHVIFIDDINPHAKDRLLTRFKTTLKHELMCRVHIAPRCSSDDFLSHLHEATVLLDPIHFGSGNTAFEALSVGTPIITWPSVFMRGRITQGCYHAMGNDTLNSALIAKSREDYVKKAIAVASQPTLRTELSALITKYSQILWNNPKVVDEFTELFTQLYYRHAAKPSG